MPTNNKRKAPSIDGAKNKKKTKGAPKPLHPWGRPLGANVGDVSRSQVQKFDLDALAHGYATSDPEDIFRGLGFPAGLEYEDGTKLESMGVSVDDHGGSTKEAGKAADKILVQRTKKFEPWCFLAPQVVSASANGKVKKPQDRLCITYDGVKVNTRLLLKKVEVLATETAWGKPITFQTTEIMRKRAAALMAFTPTINGNGVFQ